MSSQAPIAINDSFVSPLLERFGDVRVGRGVILAGNTILRSTDPRRLVCVGDRTNAEDNVLVLSLSDRRGVSGPCGRRSTNVGERTSLAHQAEVINSRIGDFAFVGFRATDLELRHRGRRTSIRADVGSPFIIGDSADIEDRVSFHALSGTSIRIGANLDTDDNVVFHGPLVVGDNLTIADDAVLFRANVGNRVTIGDSAVIAGPADDPIELRDGVTVPEGTIITTQARADALR